MPTSWNTYVALGDSLTEGMCDTSRMPPGVYHGWADRLAMLLAASHPTGTVRFANLAVRSRRTQQVAVEQLPRAVGWGADLVSILVGGNDLTRPGCEPHRLAQHVDDIVAHARNAGADVLLGTMYRPRYLVMTPLTRRIHRFDEDVRDIAARRGCTLLDLWGMPELADPRSWAEDRVHLSSRGHRTLAFRAAENLGALTDPRIRILDTVLHEGADAGPDATQLSAAQWGMLHAAPWLWRRMRGRHAGDGVVAKDAGGLREVRAARGLSAGELLPEFADRPRGVGSVVHG